MDMHKWLSNLSRFLILLPGIASCYLPAGRHMKYPPAKTALFCLAVLIPYSLAASASATLLQINPDIILLPSLLPFFFLYRHTVESGLLKPSLRSLPTVSTLICTRHPARQIFPRRRRFFS